MHAAHRCAKRAAWRYIALRAIKTQGDAGINLLGFV